MNVALRPHDEPFGRRRPVVPSGVLGMLVFITAEIMLFAGMMSGYTIVRASNLPLNWPPAGQPRLPIASTAFNTAALLLSGVALYFAHRAFKKTGQMMRPLLLSVLLGSIFVGLQGAEWVALIRQGLTMTSSPLGSFFYLIVGTHGMHALIAIGLLMFAAVKAKLGSLKTGQFNAIQAFWYFVVGMWPVIYSRVYFG